MRKLPAGWAETILGEIGELIRGVTYKKAEADSEPGDGRVPLLRATNIVDGVLVLDGELVYVPPSRVSDAQLLSVGDIVIAASSGSRAVVGKSAPLRHEWSGTFGAFCSVARPVAHIDASYIAHFVGSETVRRRWSYLATGTNINNLKREHFTETPVPVPPLNEQRRIVAAIEEHLSRLAAADASLAAASARVRSLQVGMLVQALDRDWPAAAVGDVAEVISGPAFKSSFFGGPGEGIRLLRGENIEPGALRWRDTRTWPESMLDGYKHLFVEQSDLILAMDRPVISSGLKLAPVQKDDLPALLVQRVARIRPSERMLTGFLHAVLQLPRFIPHVIGDQTGTQLPHITLAGIRAFQVPLPPLDEQRRIVAEIEERLGAIDALRAAIERAQRKGAALRRLVLERGFRGELVPQDPSDEPARVLLDRIRAARAKSGSATGRRRTTMRR